MNPKKNDFMWRTCENLGYDGRMQVIKADVGATFLIAIQGDLCY